MHKVFYYWYIPRALLLVFTFLIFVSIKRPRPCYQKSVPITGYVRINFVPILNQIGGVQKYCPSV